MTLSERGIDGRVGGGVFCGIILAMHLKGSWRGRGIEDLSKLHFPSSCINSSSRSLSEAWLSTCPLYVDCRCYSNHPINFPTPLSPPDRWMSPVRHQCPECLCFRRDSVCLYTSAVQLIVSENTSQRSKSSSCTCHLYIFVGSCPTILRLYRLTKFPV